MRVLVVRLFMICSFWSENQARIVRRRTCENITASLDDDTYRRARIVAAERATPVSAPVKRDLTELGSGESESERLKREEGALRAHRRIPRGRPAVARR